MVEEMTTDLDCLPFHVPSPGWLWGGGHDDTTFSPTYRLYSTASGCQQCCTEDFKASSEIGGKQNPGGLAMPAKAMEWEGQPGVRWFHSNAKGMVDTQSH